MAQKFRVVNAKGLFVELAPCALVSVAVAKRLREEVLPGMEGKGGGKLSDYEKVLDALEALPVFQGRIGLSACDEGFDPAAHARFKAEASRSGRPLGEGNWPRGLAPCHGWRAPGNAKGASSSWGETDCPGAAEAGWGKIGAVAARLGLLNEMLRAAEAPTVADYHVKGASSAAKKGRDYSFAPIDPASELASCDGYVLFCARRGNSGFLDDKGNFGPLARSRSFESAAAAARTASARGLDSWKVVRTSLELAEAVDTPGDSWDGALGAALALREAEMVEQALAVAGIERIKAKLAELEAAAGLGQEQPAAPKRNRL